VDAREGKRKAAVPTPRRARERKVRGSGRGFGVAIVVAFDLIQKIWEI
jgi:hypothetical protein